MSGASDNPLHQKMLSQQRQSNELHQTDTDTGKEKKRTVMCHATVNAVRVPQRTQTILRS